jgi:hypothetical protein
LGVVIVSGIGGSKTRMKKVDLWLSKNEKRREKAMQNLGVIIRGTIDEKLSVPVFRQAAACIFKLGRECQQAQRAERLPVCSCVFLLVSRR